MKTGDEKYIVTRGFIDGKNDSGALYGVFLTVLLKRKLKYVGAFFSRERMDRKMPLANLVSLLREDKKEKGEESFSPYCIAIREYLSRNSRVNLQEDEIADNKPMERNIAFFCSDVLGINPIVFVDVADMTEEDILALMPFLAQEQGPGVENSEEATGGKSSDFVPKTPPPVQKMSALAKEFFISCEAILDPIAGVPVNELLEGNRIFCRLPESSVYYKFFVNRIPSFDGTIIGDVTGVKIKDDGMAVIAVDLADDLTGAMKLSSKIRVKTADRRARHRSDPVSKSESIVALASLVSFLCLMWILIHFFS